jgi:hypothetical protein
MARTGKKKMLKCMNSKPDQSKWGDWAPDGGCKEKVEVDESVAKVLCWRCTSRTTTMPGDYQPDLK